MQCPWQTHSGAHATLTVACAHVLLPAQATHQVLNVMDFTSARARMSVVLRAPDGTIRLHCKGSDAIMLPRLRPDTDPALLAATHDNLHAFSVNVRSPLSAALCLAPARLLMEQYATLADTAGCMPKHSCCSMHCLLSGQPIFPRKLPGSTM